MVIQEVLATPDPEVRKAIEKELRASGCEHLGALENAAPIAEAIRKAGRFSERMLVDLTHVEYAILSDADAVVTWDARTLARDRVRVTVHAWCQREGYTAPLIGGPEEVAEWLGLAM